MKNTKKGIRKNLKSAHTKDRKCQSKGSNLSELISNCGKSKRKPTKHNKCVSRLMKTQPKKYPTLSAASKRCSAMSKANI